MLAFLAFGENSVKSRVKNILNYRKPIFWLGLAAVIVALAAAVCLLTNPLEQLQPYNPTSSETLPQGISVRTEYPAYSINSNKIKLIIQNDTEADLTYGSRYAIEKFDAAKGKWYQVPFAKNVAFDAILNSIKAGGSDEFLIFLSMMQDKPSAGKYRAWVLDDRTNCEFELVSDASSSISTAPADSSMGDVTILTWYGGQTLQGQVVTDDAAKRLVEDLLLEGAVQSSIYPAITTEAMGNYVTIQIKDYPNAGTYYLFSKDDQHYLQYGLTGMYSKIDQKTYEPFVFEVMGYQGMIGTKGLPLPYTLTVRSGDKACLAMAHIIEHKDKSTAATETTAPLKPQDVTDKLQYLTIDRTSETDHPFTPYIKGSRVYGAYALYNSKLEKVPFFEPSGLAPQTYIFSKAEPGQYIIEFRTGVDDANATYTCQYFFGVYLPEE